MNKGMVILIVSVLSLLFACNAGENNETQTNTVTPINIEKGTDDINGTLSKQATAILNKKNDFLSSYKILESENELIIAIKVDFFQQFTEQKIEKKLEKELKEKLHTKKIKVSSDEKIYIEISKLENNEFTNTEKKKKFTKLKKLMKDNA
ncbi:hypothetical protein [Saliterribacillus persicus]|uniref:Sporulation lipoprotein YhcN/YlaJ n=1 Tax=Saliterribacillus persicus TaxID=930114 RepID=A0A368Y0S7_9BACI|nr:hypothetical protein [Saliterribacillus persicus]RCW71854.1 hypothetical protein DFR57_10536 [Saliterribacillus persicus]